MGALQYEERAVAFVDVLGFSDLVHESVRDSLNHSSLAVLVSILNGAMPSLNKNTSSEVPERLKPEWTQFSDSLLISSPIKDPEGERIHYCGLATVILRVTQLAHLLLEEGHLIRGGISIGKLYHDNEMCVGPAMIDAYKTEQSVSLPIVTLDQAANEYWRSSSFHNSPMCIYDGRTSRVNTLFEFFIPGASEAPDWRKKFANYTTTARRIASETDRPGVASKWEWFRWWLEEYARENDLHPGT